MGTRLGVTAPNSVKDSITHDLILVNMNGVKQYCTFYSMSNYKLFNIIEFYYK